MRVFARDRERSRYEYVGIAEALVVGGRNERPIDAGRFDFERVGGSLRFEGSIDLHGDALAQCQIHAARPIDRKRKLRAATARPRALRDDFDLAKFFLERQRARRVLERLG